jgi:hypothetical protein
LARECGPSQPLPCSVLDGPLTQKCTVQHIAVLHTKPYEEETHATQQLVATNLLGQCKHSLASSLITGMTCISTGLTPAHTHTRGAWPLHAARRLWHHGSASSGQTTAQHSTGDEHGRIDTKGMKGEHATSQPQHKQTQATRQILATLANVHKTHHSHHPPATP